MGNLSWSSTCLVIAGAKTKRYDSYFHQWHPADSFVAMCSTVLFPLDIISARGYMPTYAFCIRGASSLGVGLPPPAAFLFSRPASNSQTPSFPRGPQPEATAWPCEVESEMGSYSDRFVDDWDVSTYMWSLDIHIHRQGNRRIAIQRSFNRPIASSRDMHSLSRLLSCIRPSLPLESPVSIILTAATLCCAGGGGSCCVCLSPQQPRVSGRGTFGEVQCQHWELLLLICHVAMPAGTNEAILLRC